MLEPGTSFDHRYEIVRTLGRGAMATVYLARHTGLLSQHAIKVLEPRYAESSDLRSRFLSEGRIQATIRHPHIVSVTDIVAEPVPGLVLEYVEGPDLHVWASARWPFTLEDLQALLLPILDAVGTAHQVGVIHRDLKPENILVATSPEGRPVPKLTDFGIAKLLEQSASLGGRAPTRDGTRLGTLLYMSPEQVRAQPVDHRSDIFSLGAVLYELATARVAFEAPSDFDTMERILVGAFEPPERVIGHLPPGLAAVIRTALAVDPAERFQSCADFSTALARAGDVAAAPPPRPSRSFAVTIAPIPPPNPPAPTLAGLMDSAPILLPERPAAPPPAPEPAVAELFAPEAPPALPARRTRPDEVVLVTRNVETGSSEAEDTLLLGVRAIGAVWLVTALFDTTVGLALSMVLYSGVGLLCGMPFGGWLSLLLLPLGLLQVLCGAWMLVDPAGAPGWLVRLTALSSLLSPCLGGLSSWLPALGALLAWRDRDRGWR